MQVDDRRVAEGSKVRSGRGLLVGIAAAAAVLIVGLIYGLTGRDPVTAPAPNAVRLPGGTIAPGAYWVETDRNETTTTRGTFVINTSGWNSLEAGVMKDSSGIHDGAYVSLMVVQVEQVLASCDGAATLPSGATAKALGDQFAAMSGFITRESLTPVSAFGRDGYHLVLEVPGHCTGESRMVWFSPVWRERFYQTEGQIVEFWFLDVSGTTVMVEATRHPESNAADVAELNAILRTLVITP